MQLLLSFALKTSSETESEKDVWATLPSEHRAEAVEVLARLLAKTTTQSMAQNATEKRKDRDDD